MKTIRIRLPLCFLLLSFAMNAQVPTILQDWEAYVGIQDSTFKTPVIVDDSGYVYVATFDTDPTAGAVLIVTKYNDQEEELWQEKWNGPGNSRDQASDIFYSDGFVYVCGVTFPSANNNFDFVTLKLDAWNGQIQWYRTYNGTSSAYDVATSIFAVDKLVIVSGTSNQSGSGTDFVTIAYDNVGNFKWMTRYDYSGLLDIPITMEPDDGFERFTVVGAGQLSLTEWNYLSLTIDTMGSIIDTVITSGTSSGFDCANGVTFDHLGNVYITGSVADISTGHDIKTVVLSPTGSLLADVELDESGGEDIGYDVLVDSSFGIYVCGKVEVSGQDEFYVIKFKPAGTILWEVQLMGNLDDVASAMCFDAYGNIIVTGEYSQNGTDKDFLTIGFDADGNEIWRDYYDGPYHGDDRATSIAADANGNIYVTGQVTTEEGLKTVTIRYRTDFYTDPFQADTPIAAFYYYPNEGQLTTTEGDGADSVDYYMYHHNPKLYFGEGVMNMLWARITDDTTIADSLHRVDVSFLNSTNVVSASPVDDLTETREGYLNYFLSHCTNGITSLFPSQKLLYPDVWDDIDVVFSSNSAGLKIYFICKPYSDPTDIGLLFNGHDNLQVLNNLIVTTSLGNYEFERPKIYQVDNSNNITTLSWLLSWDLVAPDQVKLFGLDEYDLSKTLVVEVGKLLSGCPNPSINNLAWSAYFGGGLESITDMAMDKDNDVCITGVTFSGNLPLVVGVSVYSNTHAGSGDAFALQMNLDNKLIWATYIGGTANDYAKGIAVDASGNSFVVGATGSSNFPTDNPGNGASYDNQLNGIDGFIFQLDPTGNHSSSTWSTLFGGSGNDHFLACKIDLNNNLFIVGLAGNAGDGDESTDFPEPITQPSGSFVQRGYKNISCTTTNGSSTITTATTSGIVNGSKVAGTGISSNTTVVSTTATTITLDSQCSASGISNIRFYGRADGLITKFNATHELVWSTLVCGSNADGITDIDIDLSGNVFVTGTTASSDFPTLDLSGSTDFIDLTLSGFGDAFVMKFNNNGQQIWSTFYGGQGDESFDRGIDWQGELHTHAGPAGGGIAVNNVGEIFVTGSTNSTDASLVQSWGNAFQRTNPAGKDAFLVKFSSNLARVWGTYFGGDGDEWGNDIAIHPDGRAIYLSGSASFISIPLFSQSTPFYSQANEGGLDAFIAGFSKFGKNVWGTYLGGDFFDKALTSLYEKHGTIDRVRLGGDTYSTNWNVISSNSTVEYHDCTWNNIYDGFITTFDCTDLSNLTINVENIKNLKNKMLIFPSPANKYVEILFEDNFHGNLEIEMHDYLGKFIKSYQFVKNGREFRGQINIENLSSGIYLLRIENSQENKSTRFIKE